ncbi:acyl-CoA thioesterase [Bacteriovoracaceae bacterium]|nr:acyl-CoA thioesterase [Bacteriovoracaceae bacterium]
MLNLTILPRFNDTDALGHINNASIATWFEEARRPIFKKFIPDLNPKKWNLIIAKVEIEYLSQSYYQADVIVQTEFEKIGNSSMTIFQKAIQNGKEIASGRCVMVYYDYDKKAPISIPNDLKQELQKIA